MGDWEKRIRGLCEFGNPNFLIHRNDTRRMREALYIAKLNRAKLDDILDVLAEYYRSVNSSDEFISEQKDRLADYYKLIKFQKLKKKAWLIYWQSFSREFLEEDVIAIMDSRKSYKYVSDFVLDYYISHTCSVEDKLHYVSHKREFPYPVEPFQKDGIQWYGRMHCGHDPFIDARLVNNIGYTQGCDGQEMLHWESMKPATSLIS